MILDCSIVATLNYQCISSSRYSRWHQSSEANQSRVANMTPTNWTQTHEQNNIMQYRRPVNLTAVRNSNTHRTSFNCDTLISAPITFGIMRWSLRIGCTDTVRQWDSESCLRRARIRWQSCHRPWQTRIALATELETGSQWLTTELDGLIEPVSTGLTK